MQDNTQADIMPAPYTFTLTLTPQLTTTNSGMTELAHKLSGLFREIVLSILSDKDNAVGSPVVQLFVGMGAACEQIKQAVAPRPMQTQLSWEQMEAIQRGQGGPGGPGGRGMLS